MICLYMWIEWLSVVDIEFMCQKSYVWICCVFGEKWWMMKLWFDEFGMNSWIIVVVDVWKTCCWWIGMLSMPLMNWWWKLLLLLNNFESLVKFWIQTKWCLIHDFWACLCMCLCTWPINFIWDEFLSVGGSKLEILGKRVLKFEVFFLNCRAFAQASSERTSSECAHELLDTVCLIELRAKLWANGNVASVKSSLEQSASEPQTNTPRSYWDLVG